MIKIDFDSASKGNQGPCGAGFMARDMDGNIVAMATRKLEDGVDPTSPKRMNTCAVVDRQPAEERRRNKEAW